MQRILLAVLLSLVLLPASALCQVIPAPEAINFQGRLAKPDGTPVPDGSYSIRFRLYNAAAVGTVKWEQTIPNVQTHNGAFAVLLNVSTGDADLFAGNRWLEIKIGTDLALQPRQQLYPVAFALKANTVPDGAIGTAQLATGAVTSAKIADGAIGANQIAGGLLNFWRLTGNSGTDIEDNFLGTTDDTAFDIRVNNQRVMRYDYQQTNYTLVSNTYYRQGNNIIGGYRLNGVSGGVVAGTIGGGGHFDSQGNATYNNFVSDLGGTIGGGSGNRAGDNDADTDDALFNTVGGGFQNIASGQYTTIGGGTGNASDGNYAFIGGGQSNQAGGTYTAVGGGKQNTASGAYAAIGGGFNNNTTGSYAAVGGGRDNEALGFAATIGGGRDNDSTDDYATIAGGFNNAAFEPYATVGGGYNNVANASYASVLGGFVNFADGLYSTVAGGSDNSASGDYSFAAGHFAGAGHTGSFVWADSFNNPFPSTAADQFSVRSRGGVRFYTSSNLSSGVTLTAGDSSWNSVSDRNAKRNFQSVDTLDVLERLGAMPVTTWNYKTRDDILHIGVMAQDFFAAFGLGTDDKHISTVDADGVAFAAIQGLYRKVKTLETENATLREQLKQIETQGTNHAALRKQLDALLERLTLLEGRIP